MVRPARLPCKSGEAALAADLIMAQKFSFFLCAGVITYTSIITACAKHGDVEQAGHWHRLMVHDGLRPDAVCMGAMVDCYAKKGAPLELSCASSWSRDSARRRGARRPKRVGAPRGLATSRAPHAARPKPTDPPPPLLSSGDAQRRRHFPQYPAATRADALRIVFSTALTTRLRARRTAR